MKVKTYRYEWKTGDEILENINSTRKFTIGITNLAKIIGNSDSKILIKANELWLKLKDAFNAEALYYDPKLQLSKLGSIGEIDCREVCRSAWYDYLDGDKYGEYDMITFIIEMLHNGEKLETGTITFGS